eukprot:1151889-Pelagomonas_calceolata.AAC.5
MSGLSSWLERGQRLRGDTDKAASHYSPRTGLLVAAVWTWAAIKEWYLTRVQERHRHWANVAHQNHAENERIHPLQTA